jgi:hypothetical protein
MQKVGSAAAAEILRSARALATNNMLIIGPAAIPKAERYVMLDLEGLPPQLDELEKFYLWAIHVYGARPVNFMPATAGFATDGDHEGWKTFLGQWPINLRKLWRPGLPPVPRAAMAVFSPAGTCYSEPL